MAQSGTSGQATELPADALRAVCDPGIFDFATTATLDPLPALIGQERATEAIALAAGMRHKRFNLFVAGPQGTGRHSAVLRMLEEEAATRPAPGDWVHVYNFENADRPRAMALPRGTALGLRDAMQVLVDDLANDIPALFDSEEYQNRRTAIEQEFGGHHEVAFSELNEKARRRGVAILRTPMGFAIAAVKDGEVIKPDAFSKLPEDERKQIEARVAETQGELEEFLKSVPQMEKSHRRAVGKLNAEMAEQAVDAALTEVLRKFGRIDAVRDYLAELRADLISNATLFLKAGRQEDDGPFPVPAAKVHDDPAFHRYAVNVMVGHAPDEEGGAPVVTEALPTLGNLTGRVEHMSSMGALVTDFTLIRPGALHRANGGFLVLDAERVLTEPFAWEALKRCLETGEIKIISPAQRYSLLSTTTLEPDPIPLDARVVLVGDRRLHMLLSTLDPEFGELFKITADFDDDMARDDEALTLFARMVATVAGREGLLPATPEGVAALVDFSTREADDQQKLSLRISAIWDILREADHLARRAEAKAIEAEQVAAAIRAARRRASRVRDRIQEMIARDTIMISTRGAELGQVNGLTVTGMREHRFGAPVRITARVRMGAGKVVDIEREVKLGGPIHSKGVLILSGYLSTHYAPEMPLSLWASLVFEQSYGGVDGDSASVAELCALLSALAGVPLSQSLAVTGSVNQQGEVQPVGGVNEKIEGFFDVCKAQGLTGRQGVLLPRRNAANLMLREDVVEAVRAGKFAIHAISSVDQAIELLTGLPAGRRAANGQFPDGSVNANVEARLEDFALARRDFAGSGRDGDGNGNATE
ncbi:Lon protease family protein [Alkalilacustris brevis]|uniref:Lon protease family protein n=1 Tax=Alkalilacustris brevis TaxID=2026338 RepID=UPI000E0D7365|nr:ATP-binding protein [Alkalilacustris brevis]